MKLVIKIKRLSDNNITYQVLDQSDDCYRIFEKGVEVNSWKIKSINSPALHFKNILIRGCHKDHDNDMIEYTSGKDNIDSLVIALSNYLHEDFIYDDQRSKTMKFKQGDIIEVSDYPLFTESYIYRRVFIFQNDKTWCIEGEDYENERQSLLNYNGGEYGLVSCRYCRKAMPVLFGQFKKCKDFLELNGAKFIDKDDEYYNFDFDGFGISLAIDNSEIVFIGDSGDFAHINLSYYELLGFMIEKHFIGIGFKSPTK